MEGVVMIAVGMSGGLDSSVAASLLVEQGESVLGVTAVMTGEVSRCCAPEDVEQAGLVCRHLGIEHRIVHVEDAFKRDVIDYFSREYLAGRTPSPCVQCNRLIKFGAMLDAVADSGCTVLASGHYARVIAAGGGLRLMRGVDGTKDQSYFLARLSAAQLARALFPLGGWTKREAMDYAARVGLPCGVKGESQELCFVGDGAHGAWMDVRVLNTPGSGAILDKAGRQIGRHEGIHHYTVGQRRGLGVAVGKPAYVVSLDAERNIVVVGGRDDVLSGEMLVCEMEWADGFAGGERETTVQIRYKHEPCGARVVMLGGGRARVFFAEPQFAVTPGQFAVFYDGDAVVGSGWIGAGP